MVRSKYKHKYIAVSLQKELMLIVRKRVDKDPSYTSTADFVRSAIREKLQGLGDIKK